MTRPTLIQWAFLFKKPAAELSILTYWPCYWLNPQMGAGHIRVRILSCAALPVFPGCQSFAALTAYHLTQWPGHKTTALLCVTLQRINLITGWYLGLTSIHSVIRLMPPVFPGCPAMHNVGGWAHCHNLPVLYPHRRLGLPLHYF